MTGTHVIMAEACLAERLTGQTLSGVWLGRRGREAPPGDRHSRALRWTNRSISLGIDQETPGQHTCRPSPCSSE